MARRSLLQQCTSATPSLRPRSPTAPRYPFTAVPPHRVVSFINVVGCGTAPSLNHSSRKCRRSRPIASNACACFSRVFRSNGPGSGIVVSAVTFSNSSFSSLCSSFSTLCSLTSILSCFSFSNFRNHPDPPGRVDRLNQGRHRGPIDICRPFADPLRSIRGAADLVKANDEPVRNRNSTVSDRTRSRNLDARHPSGSTSWDADGPELRQP